MRTHGVRRALIGAGTVLLGTLVGGALLTGTAAANEKPADQDCLIPGDYLPSSLVPGSVATVTFTVPAGCEAGVELTLASYSAPSGSFNPAERQLLVDYVDQVFMPGTHTISVDVPNVATGGNPADCSVQHDNSQGRGANTSPGPYDNTCTGAASQNGRGGGNASGRPCAGCVGNADDKNPPGQYPNGTDRNAGYECDRNQGIGQTNPAHTGCVSRGYQVDFAYGPVIQVLGDPAAPYGGFYSNGPNGGGLIDWVNGTA
jgi:hypothetical protein